jgi:hypothetical protein
VWSKGPITTDTLECTDEISSTCYIVVDEGRYPPNTKEVTVSFTIPEASYGTNFLQFQRGYRPENPYGFTFLVVPDIKVTPPSVSPGSRVTIKGTGFPGKNKTIKVSFDGTDTKVNILTSEQGSFTADFTIPDTIAGNHQFQAIDESLSLGDITTNLQVVPTISLQPEHPEIGAEVTLTGSGFAAKSIVAIKYDDLVVSNSPTTDDNGNFTEKFVVPESSKDNNIITATDKAGNVATYGMPLEGTAPSVPTPISPAQQRFGLFGSQPVMFTWTACSDPSGVTYTLQINKGDMNWFPPQPGMVQKGLSQPNYVTRLGPGTYFWRVKAVDGAGNESDWQISPYPFQVGLFSGWYLAVGAIIFLIIFIFIVRAFFRRVREYYK